MAVPANKRATVELRASVSFSRMEILLGGYGSHKLGQATEVVYKDWLAKNSADESRLIANVLEGRDMETTSMASLQWSRRTEDMHLPSSRLLHASICI